MIHIVRDGELPPNHVNFRSRLLQKLLNKRHRIEITNDNLYRKYFYHTGKVTSKQIIVSDNIHDNIVSTLYNNPM